MSKLKKKDALHLYRLMCGTRADYEARIIHRGQIPGPELTGLGQEAMAVVPPYVLFKLGLLPKSPIHGDHRALNGIVKVVDERIQNSEKKLSLDLTRNYFCRSTGGNYGRSGNVHILWPDENLLGLGSSDMGVWPAVLSGFLEEKMRATDWDSIPGDRRFVGLAYLGDGASNQGIVPEAMNWAWTYRLPMIFCINNNQVALFTSPTEGHGDTELYRRASGYGKTVGMRVDGTDPAAVYDATLKAIEHAQNRIPVLIEFCTFRLTGHNEDHIERVSRPSELRDKRNFFDVKAIFGFDDERLAEFREAAKNEPLARTQRWLVANGLLQKEKCQEDPLRDPIIDEARARADALVEQVLSEPKITVEGDSTKNRSAFSPLLKSKISHMKESRKTQRMKYNPSFSWIVAQIMKEDERVVYRGEDVKQGGVLALTKGILDELREERVRNTPISEEMIAAAAAGRALAGGFPISEFQFGGFSAPSFRILRHVVATQWFEKRCRSGQILVYPCGIVHEGGSGEYHERWPARELLTIPGIAIVSPTNAHEVVGLVRAAHESGWPVALLLQTSAASSAEFESEIPLEPYTIPLGKAHVSREGTDYTVVVYDAACAAAAKNEAEFLAEEGISVEIIILRTLKPLDIETIMKSLQKTGRMCFMHEDYYTDGSPGEQMIGMLAQRKDAFETLCTPNIPVLGASTPFSPTDLDLVRDRLPYKVVVSKDGKKKFHRSPKLAMIIKDGMKYGRA